MSAFCTQLLFVFHLILSGHVYVLAEEEVEKTEESTHQENIYIERHNSQEDNVDKQIQNVNERFVESVSTMSEQECDNDQKKYSSEKCSSKPNADIVDNNDRTLDSENQGDHPGEQGGSNVGQTPPLESDPRDLTKPKLDNVDNFDQTQLPDLLQREAAPISSKDRDEKDNANKLPEVNEKSTPNTMASAEDSVGNQSYFSFGNILKNFVNPVLEEFERTPEVKQINEDASNISETQKNITVVVDNSTMEEIVPAANKTERKTKFTCVGKNMTLEENGTAVVNIINNTRLVNLLSFDKNETTSDCVLVLFYAPYCHFCARIGPSYNALARVFPLLEVVAVDAAQFSNLNAKFGTVSVPNIILFHQSRSAVRFNQTDKSFHNLIEFVKNSTGLNPNMTVNITEEDWIGPLPSVPIESTDYLLWLAWIFVIMCSTFMFVNSQKGQQWINKVKILWQEHQHIE